MPAVVALSAVQLICPLTAISAEPDVPQPLEHTPMMPLVSEVAALIALEGAPVNFASRFAVVPVVVSFEIVVVNDVLPRDGVLSEGVVIVGDVARTIEPLPVVPFERSLAAAVAPELTRPLASVVTFVYVPAVPTA